MAGLILLSGLAIRLTGQPASEVAADAGQGEDGLPVMEVHIHIGPPPPSPLARLHAWLGW
jgi:hypothetical protein